VISLPNGNDKTINTDNILENYILIKIDLNVIKKPLIIFIVLIVLSITVPYLLPGTFLGSYLLWIILSIIVIVYGIMVIGGLK